MKKQEQQQRGSSGLGGTGLGQQLQEQLPDVHGAGVLEARSYGSDAGRQEEHFPLAVDRVQAQLLLQLHHAHGAPQVLRWKGDGAGDPTRPALCTRGGLAPRVLRALFSAPLFPSHCISSSSCWMPGI